MPDKEIIKTMNTMALPVLASSFGQMIFSVADQAIIGRLSVEGFAAVGVVANLIYLLTGTLGALSVAFVIIFGKAIGSADNIKQSKIFSTKKASAVRNTAPTLCILRTLSRTTTRGVLELCLNVSTSILPSSSNLSF